MSCAKSWMKISIKRWRKEYHAAMSSSMSFPAASLVGSREIPGLLAFALAPKELQHPRLLPVLNAGMQFALTTVYSAPAMLMSTGEEEKQNCTRLFELKP